MLNIALPKGRLGDKTYSLFEKIGYKCDELTEDSRKLIFENKEKNIRYLLVKPSDVGIYVEKGAADIGVVGKDILLENVYDIYELLDLNLGICKISVAALSGYKEDTERKLRVATKYVNTAKKYYSSLNRETDIIKLNGSIELAPILGLSDVIVDIVETGNTLKENNLKVINDIEEISARFIANKTSYKFKNEEIKNIEKKLREVI
ncbi:ATP phosphoribosyltransferase [Sebaldella termitidis]|uniref:ATP phosphoribosyltransferase n=1 Tax=Sebaldella termitidis (strain ATCC 33386 / NCTC 11300) TaxID=526218 RepID=D1AKB2_SEBTE|nr:ATP phosphoribosyltransferase [Sebaldella termitidis]ACZ09028.1 ATP phosphoribosyltransferase [Sebaldella termitidis ATCC 33386]SUI24347.1 ATP phosphoribosyltransferase [Sebaldella termitidis]